MSSYINEIMLKNIIAQFWQSFNCIPIDIVSLLNRLLKVCYVPATNAGLNRLLFLLQPLTVLMKQTRQAICTVKQSIYLDVYGNTAD